VTAILRVERVSKHFGNVVALHDVTLSVAVGQVTCLLGDNGAGKSSLIQILAGVHRPTTGRYLVEGEPVEFSSPRQALSRGIATVYQDLAMIPLLSVWRNFFLGAEPCVGRGPFRRMDRARCEGVVREELSRLGVQLRDPGQAAGTLSGGERQAVAIARAIHFGARVLILDEPTAALGVKQAGVVLRYMARARERGVAVVFVTHNPHHAYAIGDRFVALRRGEVLGDFARSDVHLERLTAMMSGGEELERLALEPDRTDDGGATG
jgi:simple sugar transport system ATP-binding protein